MSHHPNIIRPSRSKIMKNRKSVSDLLDDLRASAEAAAIFEAIAGQASAAAQREWWTEGAGSPGALEASFSKDALRIADLAESLRKKYHKRCTKAAEQLREKAQK